MEKKTMDTLRAMLCGELEDVAKKGNLTHELLDIVKDLLDSMKNLNKIEKYQMEQEGNVMDMTTDMRGYSQRAMGRYYVDGEYGNGYSYNRRGDGYGRNIYNDSYMDGNSYLYYDPRYDHPMYSRRGGYSRTGSKQEMMDELRDMMHETNDEMVKKAISDAIDKMSK